MKIRGSIRFGGMVVLAAPDFHRHLETSRDEIAKILDPGARLLAETGR
jgi:hypothetical protein